MTDKKKNILLWKFGDDYMRGLKKHLADDLEIKVWIDKKKFRVPTHYMDDLYKQLRICRNSNRLKADYQHQEDFIKICEKVMQHTNTFMYMYSRYPALNGEHNFLDMMDAMHIYTHFFLDVLKTNRIDCVFMNRIPHRGPDYILYLVAKELKIKVFMLFQTVIPGKLFLVTDMNEVGSIESKNTDIQPVKILKRHREAPYFIKIRRKTNQYLKAFLYLFRFDPDLLLYQMINARKSGKFRHDYKRALSNSLPQGKFVYFPLHLQPELTTVSWGGIFVDQILAIEHLRALLPNDWGIVVKENPLQTFHSRGSFFFERLGKIPGVFYMGKSPDTFELIEKSEFVATVTGTVGMEALRFGKRVLIFGSAPYKNFPGVIRYTAGLTLDEILSVKFSHEEVELAHAKLQSNMIDATVSPDSVSVENFSAEENSQNLRKSSTKQQDETMNVWFATSAWERDYKVTLHKKRVWMNWHATGKEFSGRLLVLNNFENKKLLEKAKHKASIFAEKGFFSDWIHAPEYIRGKLNQFNLNEKTFWSENPYFSSAQLGALLYLQGKADFLFFMTGDVAFRQMPRHDWLSASFDKYKKAGISGFNICDSLWRKQIPKSNSRETDSFWINEHTHPTSKKYINLSDRTFFIPVSPSTPYDFNLDKEDLKRYAWIWPNYAIPCFEMYYRKYRDINSLSYGILKPINGMPLAKHKNIKGRFRRIFRQRILGRYYANGKYGTNIRKNAVSGSE